MLCNLLLCSLLPSDLPPVTCSTRQNRLLYNILVESFVKNMAINIEAYRRSYQARLQRGLEEREAGRKKALEEIKAVAPTIAAKYPAIKTVYLFGSILRPGAFRADSDVDLAVEGGSAEDYFALWRELQEAIPGWLIDLRDLPSGTLFTHRVHETGEKIYG